MGFNPSFMSANRQGARGREKVAGQDTGRHPAENMAWDDAAEFCRQLSALSEEVAAGRVYRLAHRSRVGIRLPCGNDHKILLGRSRQQGENRRVCLGHGKLRRQDAPGWREKAQLLGFIRYDRQRRRVVCRLVRSADLCNLAAPRSNGPPIRHGTCSMRGRGYWVGQNVNESSSTPWIRGRHLPSQHQPYWGFRGPATYCARRRP